MATIVAEELGLELEQVRVLAADTDLTPVDLGAYSSRQTLMAGNAAIDASRKLRIQVQEAVGDALGVPAAQVVLADGCAFDAEDGDRRLAIAEAFRLAEAKFETLAAAGSYNTPERGGDYRGGTIGASPTYSFTAHVAEVDIDLETGELRVPKLWIAHDCGRALCPVQVEGQIEGSAYMGVAELQMEHHEVYTDEATPEAGLHRRPSLLDYSIPTSLDTPDLEAMIVESIDPEGPYGAKEVGEGALHGSLPAVANAIYDAVGVWMTELPFTPARILTALREAGVVPAGPAGEQDSGNGERTARGRRVRVRT
jgi:CO/xanthine dehydrogenase Mo-binding subunit